ncbi:MAG TPA: TolC family protein [Armatimonadota bacterium]|nr:TolC family protein [Armatimonadota bacterium]
MLFRVATIVMLLLAAVGMQAPAQEPPVSVEEPPVMEETGPLVTLEEAIATAVAANPALAAARARVERAEATVDEARSQGRLQASATASYLRFSPVSTFTIPGPDGPVEVETRPSSQSSINATVSQPIDITGRIRTGVQLADIQLDIQQFGEAQALQQLILDVKNAYYGVLRAQANVEVIQASIDVALERLRIAQAQFEAGVVARFDVTQAEVDVANLRQQLIQAQGNVQIAKGVLNQTIGIDINRPFTVEDIVVDVGPVTVDVDAATEQALAARPEIQQATLGVELAETSVDFARKQDDPTLALIASADWTGQTSAFSPENTSYTYGAQITWPFFQGGAVKARVNQARSEVEIARQNLEQASLGVGLDVRSAAVNVMEASRRVQTAQANVDLAQESLRLSRVRYQEGVATSVEVTSAEAALTEALTNLVNARYDYLTAQARLQRATASQPEYEALTTPTTMDVEVEPETPEGANE